VLVGHGSAVLDVAFAPDGKTVASASREGVIRVWTPGGRTVAVLNAHHGAVWHIAYSPSGDRLVSAAADGVGLWSSAAGGGPTGATPVVTAGAIYYGSFDNRMYALAA